MDTSPTTFAASPRPGLLVTLAWVVGVLAATTVPLGGLVAGLAAAGTTYRRSSVRVRAAWVVYGLLTVALQVGTFVVVASSSHVGPPVPVPVRGPFG